MKRMRAVARPLLLLALFPVWRPAPAQAAPRNDNIAAARGMCCWPDSTEAPFVVDARTATKERGERTSTSCGTIGHTVWYKLTFDTAGNPVWPVVVTTLGSNFDTALVAYRLPAGKPLRFSNLAQVGCSDNVGNDTHSAVSFAATGAFSYWFQVGGHGTASGSRLVFTYESNV